METRKGIIRPCSLARIVVPVHYSIRNIFTYIVIYKLYITKICGKIVCLRFDMML